MNIFLQNIIHCPISTQWQAREWRNLPGIKRWMWRQHVISEDEHQAWLNNLKTDKTKLWNVILVDHKPVGIVHVSGIDVYHRVIRDEGIYLVPEAQGRGIAVKAERILLDSLFSNFAINKIGLEYITGNPVEYVHRKTGFVNEGLLHQHAILDGKPADVQVMGLTRDRWKWLKTNEDMNEDMELSLNFESKIREEIKEVSE